MTTQALLNENSAQVIGLLRQSAEQFKSFMNHSPAVAFIKDAAGRYVYANAHLEKLFNVTFAELEGKTDSCYLPEAVAAQIRENDRRILETGETLELTEFVATPDNRSRCWQVYKFPFEIGGEKFVGGVAFDITEQKETEERLISNERHYRHLVENSRGLICSHDLDGVILTINRIAAQSLGYELNEVVGRNISEFLPARVRPLFVEQLAELRQSGQCESFLPLVTKAGEERVWQYHNILISEPDEPEYVIGYAQDVTKIFRAKKELENLTLTDELTGLCNRRGFFTHAEQQLKLERRRRTARGLLLLFADLDELKQINDRHGHHAGSEAIIECAAILQTIFRDSDVVARWGGDEFVILAIGSTAENSETIMTRIQNKLDEYNATGAKPYQLKLSVGVAAVDADSTASLEEVIAEADRAMYRHKRSKKNVEVEDEPVKPPSSSSSSNPYLF